MPMAPCIGYLGADFDLRDLPLTRELYRQADQWLQLKGDPAIRGGLFYQQRVESLMDNRIDAVLALFAELITEHGVFHGKLHFSSSRATIWSLDDPYRFRVLDFEDLTNPDIRLAYPQRDYPAEADPGGGVGDVIRLQGAALHGREHLPALRLAEHLQRHRRPQLQLRRLALHALGRISAQGPGFLARHRACPAPRPRGPRRVPRRAQPDSAPTPPAAGAWYHAAILHRIGNQHARPHP
jgi:hypothetical protein